MVAYGTGKLRWLYSYSTLTGAVKVRLRYGASTRKVRHTYGKSTVKLKYGKSIVKYSKSIVLYGNFFWSLTVVQNVTYKKIDRPMIIVIKNTTKSGLQ